MDINEYFDHAKVKLGITSDYAFAKTIEYSRGHLSQLRRGERVNVDEYLAFKLAEILDMDAKEIIIDLKSQSEKNPKKKAFWLSQLASEGIAKLKRGLVRLRIIHIMLNSILIIVCMLTIPLFSELSFIMRDTHNNNNNESETWI